MISHCHFGDKIFHKKMIEYEDVDEFEHEDKGRR